MTWTVVGARRISFGMSGSPKYRNKPTLVDGHKFPSMREGNRYRALKLLEANGEVRDIKLQVEYRLEVAGQLICKYRADFVYDELRKGEWIKDVVEDVKGYRTPEYRLKRKLMKVLRGIEIRET